MTSDTNDPDKSPQEPNHNSNDEKQEITEKVKITQIL